jgi:hypothetical protein
MNQADMALAREFAARQTNGKVTLKLPEGHAPSAPLQPTSEFGLNRVWPKNTRFRPDTNQETTRLGKCVTLSRFAATLPVVNSYIANRKS